MTDTDGFQSRQRAEGQQDKRWAYAVAGCKAVSDKANYGHRISCHHCLTQRAGALAQSVGARDAFLAKMAAQLRGSEEGKGRCVASPVKTATLSSMQQKRSAAKVARRASADAAAQPSAKSPNATAMVAATSSFRAALPLASASEGPSKATLPAMTQLPWRGFLPTLQPATLGLPYALPTATAMGLQT